MVCVSAGDNMHHGMMVHVCGDDGTCITMSGGVVVNMYHLCTCIHISHL